MPFAIKRIYRFRMIPFVDLAAQYRALKLEIDTAIARAIESSAFIQGPDVAAFEAEFAHCVGARHAVGVASGTDALSLAVRALNLAPGDEVITVVNTWISTAFAANHSGAKVVLVDIDPDTYQMDIAALERALTHRTRVVIPVHLYGHPAPMPEIVALCRPYGIRIIEDVAQAPLAEIGGKKVGSFGDLACYSFYPSKNLGCYGDGGAVTTDDDSLAAAVRCLANYGQHERYRHDVIGFNSRLDTMQAAILRTKLPYLEAWTQARRLNARRYDDRIAGLPIKRPYQAPGARAVYHLYVVEVPDRDACFAYLRERGVMVQVHYPEPIHTQPCYTALGYRAGDFPKAEAACRRILSLPMYPELTENQIDQVVETLAAFLKERV